MENNGIKSIIEGLDEETILSGKKCLELGYPWFVPEAVYKLEEVLNNNDSAFEVGMGGSTVFLRNHCRYTISVETNYQWYRSVRGKFAESPKDNIGYSYVQNEDGICDAIERFNVDNITLLSVDPQGGINRSRIFNLFLSQPDIKSLRVIILDNYSHPELFPDHYNKGNFMGESWEMFTYDHPRWAGSGTKILVKK